MWYAKLPDPQAREALRAGAPQNFYFLLTIFEHWGLAPGTERFYKYYYLRLLGHVFSKLNLRDIKIRSSTILIIRRKEERALITIL